MEKKLENSNSKVTRTLIFLIVIFVFAVFLLLNVLLPTEVFKTLTNSFNEIAVGLAALITIIFGPTLVSRELEKDRKIKEYLKRFPHDKFGKEWEIIENEELPAGTYYLLDKNAKTKHHILNMKTVYDLGWHIYLNSSKKIEATVFNSYKVGDRIRTQGEAGE